MEYSFFQNRIFDEVEDTDNNIIISAVAGSGKTTTIEECVKRVPKGKDKIFLAFNNSIVDELKLRIKLPNTTISTMHSFCWRSLIRSKNGKVELVKNKSFKIIQMLCKKEKVDSKLWGFYSFAVSKLVDVMRQSLITHISDLPTLGYRYDIEVTPEMANIAVKTLEIMNKSNNQFDFTDMIYRTYLDNVRLPKFDYVFVDESQDLSTLQHEIISRIIKRKGRLIAVGDPKQAIYGFAGADTNSYNNLRELLPDTVELPLSVNYRCGQRIVREAGKINGQIQPFSKNPQGEVRSGFCKEVKNGDWVLCRNLKPLIFMNLYLLRKGVKSYVKGVDIGKGLETYVKKLGAKGVSTMLNLIDKEIENEINKMRRKGYKNPLKTEKIDRLFQRRDILKVISKDCLTVNQVVLKIKSIFKEQKGGVVLSTIHKSKGLENNNVFLLCPELIPSEYAKQTWQLEQESNLMYVAITRAKKKFIYVNDYGKIETEILKTIKDE